ncbi:MAG: hypothetical protein OXU23_24830 [Candidatus Poribacteria bacterium]|nr:hypothetical protein [Candidatus Poribacteria bacterium]
MNGKIAMRILSLLAVLGIAIFFGSQVNSETPENSKAFTSIKKKNSEGFTSIEKTEATNNSGRFSLIETTKLTKNVLSTAKDHTGPQTAQALIDTFDKIYNHNHLATTVTVIVHRKTDSGTILKNGKTHISEFTIAEIDAQYPRETWLQLLLDNGITIENFGDYTSYLSKRYTLAFLKDNPNLRNPVMIHIPPTDDWETYQRIIKGNDWERYKAAFIYKLVNRHIEKIREAAEKIERRKEKVEHGKEQAKQVMAQIERAKAQVERTKEQIERAKNKLNLQQFENVRKQIEHLRKTLERLKESMPPQDANQKMKKKPSTIQI